MSTEIPAELLLPTIEELEERTSRDLATKWKLRKRPGKKERNVMKHEKEAAKRKAIAEESNKSKQPIASNLSSLFVKKENSGFSLNDVNIGTAAKTIRPTLRVSLGEHTSKPIAIDAQSVRKRGRPPKVNPI
jgi:FKBP-type peptidyl-prolyl cis-trans isomerase